MTLLDDIDGRNFMELGHYKVNLYETSVYLQKVSVKSVNQN